MVVKARKSRICFSGKNIWNSFCHLTRYNIACTSDCVSDGKNISSAMMEYIIWYDIMYDMMIEYLLVWPMIQRYVSLRWKILLVLHQWFQVGLLFSRANFNRRGKQLLKIVLWSWWRWHWLFWVRIFQITTKGGWICNGVCSKMASSYNFCEIRGKASFFEKSWWDFCTPKWTK